MLKMSNISQEEITDQEKEGRTQGRKTTTRHELKGAQQARLSLGNLKPHLQQKKMQKKQVSQVKAYFVVINNIYVYI